MVKNILSLEVLKHQLQREALWVLNNLCKCLEEGSQISTINNPVISCYIYL